MSYSRIDGKDEIHFVTKADLSYMSKEEEEEGPKVPAQSAAAVSEAEEQYPGAVSPDGNINWDCPCLGGLGSEGPCVDSFKEAFSCWFFSESEEKGEECVEKFFDMSDCMKNNAEFYDDLNARNKAEAEKSREEYEASIDRQIEEESQKEMVTAGEEIDLDVLDEDSTPEEKLIFETISDLADAPAPQPTSEPTSDPFPEIVTSLETTTISDPTPVAVSIDTSDLIDTYSDKVHSFSISSVIVAASSEEEEAASEALEAEG